MDNIQSPNAIDSQFCKTYIIFDFEWNQPIPWIRTKVDPKVLPGEIIEIGAVKLEVGEQEFKISQPFQVDIRPVCYTVMNKNVARVTNKISSDLKLGIGFVEAYRLFQEWCGADYILAGWGNSDLAILKSNLKYHGLKEDLNHLFLDVQPFFSSIYEGTTKQRSVEYAVDFLEIPKTFDFHSALRDAQYTGRVLQKIFKALQKESTSWDVDFFDNNSQTGLFKYIKKNSKNYRLSFFLQNPDVEAQTLDQTDIYPSWESCFVAYQTNQGLCPACGQVLDNPIPWFRLKKSAFSLWYCSDHFMISGRMKMKKTPTRKFYATIHYKLTNPAAARVVVEKYQEYQEYGHQGKPVILPDVPSTELEPYLDLDQDTERDAF